MIKPKINLLTLMIMAYAGLLFLAPSDGISALLITKDNMLQLLMVMPIILAMTALTKAWVPEEVISSKLGKESGGLGLLLAFVLGSVSAGPIYAAFPFAKALLDKGASLRNITILLSSWAVIKVPMLANEMAFLGVKFMITRWILTVLAILILSIILDKSVNVDDILHHDDNTFETITSLKIDISSKCSGCGVCLKILPDEMKPLIQIQSSQAQIVSDMQVSTSIALQLKKSCPRNAISY